MKPGKKWENKIKQYCKREQIFCYRLKDSPSSFYKEDKNIRFTSNNIADFFLYCSRNLFIVEAKSTANTSLPYANFRKSQIVELTANTNRFDGVIVLCFVEFRKYGEAYVIEWSKMREEMDKEERKSWSYKFIKENGKIIEEKIGVILGGNHEN